MKLNDYSWNEHERKIKEQEKEFQPSKPKIKIMDDTETRNKIEEGLEKMPQVLLAQWSLEVALPFLVFLDSNLQNDLRIKASIEVLQKRINGEATAHEIRKAGFSANELAKESETNISKYAARTFAQAIATGHMRGHALVSSDYAVKTVNCLTAESLESATRERGRQLRLAKNLLK